MDPWVTTLQPVPPPGVGCDFPGKGSPPFGASGASVCLRVLSYLGKCRQEGWPLCVLVMTVTSQPLGFRSCLKLLGRPTEPARGGSSLTLDLVVPSRAAGRLGAALAKVRPVCGGPGFVPTVHLETSVAPAVGLSTAAALRSLRSPCQPASPVRGSCESRRAQRWEKGWGMGSSSWAGPPSKAEACACEWGLSVGRYGASDPPGPALAPACRPWGRSRQLG